nr:hypothetical protein [Bacteroides intestinalis]
MDDRRQYARKVVMNIIRFMAQVGAGIKPSKEEIEAIPEEFHADIMATLLAARMVKKAAILNKMASPMEEILKKAMEEAEKHQSKKD